MSDTANSTTSDHENARGDATTDNLVESLVSLGTIWARYGIGVGRLALKTQAQWLNGVSHLLDQVADALEPVTHIGESNATARRDVTEPTRDQHAS